FTVARPVLLKHKFGATFFVTEGWDFATDKKDYMSWGEIAQLHTDGFEIGNHTLGHRAATDRTPRDLPPQLRGSTTDAGSTASPGRSASPTRATRSRGRPRRS